MKYAIVVVCLALISCGPPPTCEEGINNWLAAGCGSIGSCYIKDPITDECLAWRDRSYYLDGYCVDPVEPLWAVCPDYYDEWIDCLMNLEGLSECSDCSGSQWECSE